MRKQLIIVALVIPLTACTAFSFFFERLPWLVTWQLDRMFDLNDAQEALSEQGTEAMQDWFRQEGFPLLIVQLETVQQRWQNDEREAAARYLDIALRDWLDAFFEAVQPHVMPLLMSMTPNNAKQFRRYNKEESDDWFEYAESHESKQAHRIEKLEEWFGDLDAQQQNIVQQHVLLLDREQTIRQHNNQHWNEALMQAALSRDKAALEGWLEDVSIWWTEDYRHLRSQNRQQWQAVIEDLLPTLSERQHAHAERRVEDWLDNLNAVLED